MTTAEVKRLAHECGFELAGIAHAAPNADVPRYLEWVARGAAGAMSYLTDRRASVRTDPRNLLPSARSIISVGKLYDTPHPRSTEFTDSELAWISRYAWGSDYHELIRRQLDALVERMRQHAEFEWKICVDTAPLLERSYARDAGLGWIGKNTCLINQHAGSFLFLGEVLTSLDLEADAAVEPRCGTCTRCIDACPTEALVPGENGGWELEARLCISYFTIELRGAIPEEHRAAIGPHVFGCDICQDVCPWNSRSAMTLEPDFAPREIAPPLERLAEMTEDQFRAVFRGSPVLRAKYSGFLRNVAIAMGNSGNPKFLPALGRLASSPDPIVAEHAAWALARL
jgi:epoxyqueuosine reductase